MSNIKTSTIKELRDTVKPIRNVNIEHKRDFSSLDKAAAWVTDQVGTIGFFIVIVSWTLIWLLWNTVGPTGLRFDPYPAFVLWIFISNTIQLFLLPLLLIGQNLQEKYLEKRDDIEYELNLKSEKEIETVLSHLEYQNEMITVILEKIEGLEKPSKNKLLKK